MEIDARPCNIAPEGNNIFPKRPSVNAIEASRVFLITLWWADKLAQRVRSDIYLRFRVEKRHHFQAQNGPEKFFYRKSFLTEKYIFHVPLHPIKVVKVDSGPKLTSGSQIND